MRRFVDDDAGYLAWVAAYPGAYVLNVQRSGVSGPLVLHRAACWTITGDPSRGNRWTADWIKVCGTREDINGYAATLGRTAHPCGTCLRAERGNEVSVVAISQPPVGVVGVESAPPWTGTWPIRYRRPDGTWLKLPVEPRLASWNKSDHPDQIRLARYLDTAEALLAPAMAALPDPLALRLDVGLPLGIDLLAARDLDNYLYPLAHRLTAQTGRQFASVWGRKQHGTGSSVRVEQAQLELAPVSAAASAVVTVSASPQTEAYKGELHDQLLHLTPIEPGPVRLEITFVVGAHRVWTNLWKPTIDSLAPILGRVAPSRAWHPLDGRIVELGLHVQQREDTRREIAIAVASSAL